MPANKKERIFIVLGSTISFLLFYIFSNKIIYENQYENQILYSNKIIKYVDSISEKIVESSKIVNNFNTKFCNSNSIQNLRLITSSYKHIDDIGITAKDTLLCTANLGILDKKIKILNPDYVINKNYSIFSNVNNIYPSKKKSKLIKYDNIVLIISDFTFDRFYYFPINFNFKITSKDKIYTFIKYNSKEEKNNFHLNFFSNYVKTEVCSNKYSYCILSEKEVSSIFFIKNTYLALILTLISLILGGLFTSLIISKIKNSKSIERRLLKSVINRNIYLEYQPILLSKDKKIVGFEALLRWNDEIYGQVSPELIINISEENNFYDKLSEAIFEIGLNDFQLILNNSDLFLSFNITNYEINSKNFIDNLLKKINQKNISSKRVKFEITETIDTNLNYISYFTHNAKSKGFIVSLDDFGTGFSNVQWLVELDFDEIKLDKIFIDGIYNEVNNVFFTLLLDTLLELNKTLIFEGVENEAQYQYIIKKSPDCLVQGWLFYKSLAIKEINQMYK